MGNSLCKNLLGESPEEKDEVSMESAMDNIVQYTSTTSGSKEGTGSLLGSPGCKKVVREPTDKVDEEEMQSCAHELQPYTGTCVDCMESNEAAMCSVMTVS